MAILFVNGGVGTLASPALITDSILHLTPGQGSRFPSPTGSDYFILTLQSGAAVEVVHVTARVGDALSVTRAQEDTTALGWETGTVVDLRVTRGLLESFLQYSAGASLQLNAIDLGTDGTLTGGQISDTDIRGADIRLSTLYIGEVKPADGNTAHSLRLPNAGGNPTLGPPNAGGTSEIMTQDRTNLLGLEVRNAFPVVYLRDVGSVWSAAFHANLDTAFIIRLDGADGGFSEYDNDRNPLAITLATGDMMTRGWVLQGDGDAVSVDTDIGSLKAKLASIVSTLTDLVAAGVGGQAKAWANFAASGSVRGARNVTNVSHVGTGQWVVTLTTPMTTANCAAVASGNGPGAGALGGANNIVNAYVTGTNTVLVTAVDIANTFVDLDYVSVVVFGD